MFGFQYEQSNLKGFLIAVFIMVLWVESVKFLNKSGAISIWMRRKMIHVTTGPIYIMVWPLFDDKGSMIAACVPMLMTLKFVLVGVGLLNDEDDIKSICREGDRTELLRGPLMYGSVFIISTIMFWKEFTSILGLSALCFGDGFAEYTGRKYGGNNRLPWNNQKSYAGTIGFILFSTIFTPIFTAVILITYSNESLGVIYESILSSIPRIFCVNVMAALAESFPTGEYDNMTVFAGAVLTDWLYSHYFGMPIKLAAMVKSALS